MKKLFYTLMLGLTVGCSITDFDPPKESAFENSIVSSISSTRSNIDGFSIDDNYDVSPDEAEYMAQEFSSGKELLKVEPFEYDGEVLCYIASYDKGYKVISADKRTSIFLMESDEERFEYKEGPEFQGPSFWLNDLLSDISKLKRSNAGIDDMSNVLFWDAVLGGKEICERPAILRTHIDSIDFEDEEHVWTLLPLSIYNRSDSICLDHLLETKWGQNSPWNEYVPWQSQSMEGHCPAGCVPVAIAQILYYCHFNLDKPDCLYHGAQATGYYSAGNPSTIGYTEGTFYPYSLRWVNMPRYRSEVSDGRKSMYVGQLLAEIGHLAGIEYGPDGSGAEVSLDIFNHYDLTCDYGPHDVYRVYSSLSSSIPVLMTAYSSEGKGHAWIIDGYSKVYCYHTEVYEWRRLSELNPDQVPFHLYTEEEARTLEPNLYSGKQRIDVTSTISWFYKMNWGHDGGWNNARYGAGNSWYDGEDTYSEDKYIWYNFR